MAGAGAGAGAAADVAVTLSSVAYRMFRIRRTVCALLTKRGYIVPSEDATMNAESFAESFGGDIPNREKLGMLVYRADSLDAAAPAADDPAAAPDLDKLYVFFPANDVGVPQCKEIIKRLYAEKVKRALLVINGKFSNFAKQTLAEVAGDFVIEHFLENELLVDITEHELVPEHVVLNDVEKAALLARYKLKESQLPRIQLGDPVARFYGMQRGQVVKITRPSETAGRYVTYRIVV